MWVGLVDVGSIVPRPIHPERALSTAGVERLPMWSGVAGKAGIAGEVGIAGEAGIAGRVGPEIVPGAIGMGPIAGGLELGETLGAII